MSLPDLELSFAGLTKTPFLSVDGLQPKGPNLSHWPGNRRPVVHKSDLMTGICMRFVQASEEDQASFLGVVQMSDHAAQLATVAGTTPIHRCVANTVAGQYPVLTQITGQDVNLFCYHDRAESWFDVCTITPPPQIDLHRRIRSLNSSGERVERSAPDSQGESSCRAACRSPRFGESSTRLS